jgi:ATP-dependent RNA helicase DeaD
VDREAPPAFPALHPALAAALADRGYDSPTPVQTAVLAPEAHGRDLLVSAQTGSGKTVAYGLALAPTLLGDQERFPERVAPQALVVAPTRELALQVQRELTWLYAPAGGRVVACVGGMDIRREQRLLLLGTNVVVGTPGRLRDHLERGQLVLGELQAVVLDEADEMLDLGFREELEHLLDAAPTPRRTLLFSATIPREIEAIARQYQQDALRVATAGAREQHGDITYRAFLIAPRDRVAAVVNTLRHFEVRGALVFCSTRDEVRTLYGSLQERGFATVALSGELAQAERTRALQALRDGRARVCVATDVAARGLDLPDLGLVIHADLPRDPQLLAHRSGRTGRAGRKGTAVLLVPYPAQRYADRLLAAAGVVAEFGPAPSPEAIRLQDQQRLVREIGELLEEPGAEDREAAAALLATHEAEALVAAFVRRQRAQLPAPEELTPPPPPRERRPRQPSSRQSSGSEETVWFHLGIGRAKNADPRWIVPYLCRRGHLTKAQIGAIRVLERETHFEIRAEAVPRFLAALRRPDREDGDLLISPLRGDGPRRPPGPGPHGRPRGEADPSAPRRSPPPKLLRSRRAR